MFLLISVLTSFLLFLPQDFMNLYHFQGSLLNYEIHKSYS